MSVATHEVSRAIDRVDYPYPAVQFCIACSLLGENLVVWKLACERFMAQLLHGQIRFGEQVAAALYGDLLWLAEARQGEITGFERDGARYFSSRATGYSDRNIVRHNNMEESRYMRSGASMPIRLSVVASTDWAAATSLRRARDRSTSSSSTTRHFS